MSAFQRRGMATSLLVLGTSSVPGFGRGGARGGCVDWSSAQLVRAMMSVIWSASKARIVLVRTFPAAATLVSAFMLGSFLSCIGWSVGYRPLPAIRPK
jgi:hypothetical protein